jgi:transposase
MTALSYLYAMTKAALLAENIRLKENLLELENKNERLEFELTRLLRLVQGFKSEKFKPAQEAPANQLSIFANPEEDTPQSQVEAPAKETITYERKKNANHPGRNPIPDHLPVEEIILEPEEDTTDMIRIGEERHETLEYIPPTLKKIVRIRPKYARPDKSGIVIAPLPERPIARCLAESSLLAHIVTDKMVDHIPFYRQAKRFSRNYAWHVNESTLNDWFVAVCTLLQPLYRKLKQSALESDYIQADESTIKVLDSDKKGASHLGYMWVYHDVMHTLVLFDYHKGRGMEGPQKILRHYSGILQTDGYQVYNKLAPALDVTHVGCMAHARRKFIEAQDNDKTRAELALTKIQAIYRIDKDIQQTQTEAEEIKQQRLERLAPLYEDLSSWCETQNLAVQPKSMIGRAIGYMIKQMPKLKNVLEDGRIKLDNNLIENAIRPLALGRKNYLFAGSHEGAKRLGVMYSFFGTCKLHGINPALWLKSTLDLIQDWPINQLEQLLPGPNHPCLQRSEDQ